MYISPSNEGFAYMGRIDFTNPDAPVLFYAGSQVRFRFYGSSFKVCVRSTIYWGELSLGIILDGKMISLQLFPENNGKSVAIMVADDLPYAIHEVIVFKKHAANQLLTFEGIDIEGELCSKPILPPLKMEVYGDSVCAGEVIEAEDFVGKSDPDSHNSRYDNVWHSFVMQTARRLNAQINNICQGGIALFDGTGYFHYPDYIGLESVYDKLCYFPEGGISMWDFSLYTPDIVIIAIGQNDKHNGKTDADDIDIYDPVYRKMWKTGYIKLVNDLNNKYNSPQFVLITTILMHDKEWDKAIDEVAYELSSEGVRAFHYVFERNGKATPGHPRISEHNEMADELTNFIKSNLL
ncbi:MAG: electron transporter RnfD [Oscillospiraceae bacterium]|nr:electron transporter RnfD [Oscillospiraceae bacterium]